ncbi:MAG: hypothetical protein ACPGEF_07520 [Endozoicomonas sp.]
MNIWKLNKPDECQSTTMLHDTDSILMSVTELTDGRLVSSYFDGTIKVWEPSRPDGQQCVVTFEGHTQGEISVIQLADGRLASGSWDGTTKVWDLQPPPSLPKKEGALLNHTKSNLRAFISPESCQLI